MSSKKYMKKRIKHLFFNTYDESGQMLLFVLVVMFLLIIIVTAVIVNVRVDVKQTQLEREYEKGYSLAEKELLKINANGYTEWESAGNVHDCNPPGTFVSELRQFCDSSFDECCIADADDGIGKSIIKRKLMYRVDDQKILKDETLEIDVTGANGDITLSWDSAPAMSLMLVCDDYSVIRAAVCREGSGNCDNVTGISGFDAITSAQEAPGPLDLSSCTSPSFLRLRAVGNDALDVEISANNLPAQMELIHVQGFPAGFGENYKGLPGPEVYSSAMINKQVPALFDYVLFVGEGDVDKR